jgi:hypothetical protein
MIYSFLKYCIKGVVKKKIILHSWHTLKYIFQNVKAFNSGIQQDSLYGKFQLI